MSDLHERFAAWLEASPDRDPPRDMALHAAFCPGCQLRIAARDALAVIDLGAADRLTMPQPAADRSSLPGAIHVRPYARVLAAVVLGVATVFALVQSVDLVPASGTIASPSPLAVGAVLGATGTPMASVSPSIQPRPKARSSVAPRAPDSTEAATAQPPVSVPIAPTTPVPVPPEPTPSPSLAPTASPAPDLTAAPTSTLTPVATPTEAPTPAVTDTPTPLPSDSPPASPAP